MNTKNNQRYQETEERIIGVFIDLLQNNPLEKITVSELCKGSGINRSSFYLHFTDVYDLMDRIEERLAIYFGRLFSEPEEDYDLGERFCRMFAFIREHQDFYRVYLSSKPDFHILDGILPASADVSLQNMADRLGFRGEYEIAYHQAFFKAGLTALVREWLLRGCQESVEELSRILGREYSPKQAFFRSDENT